MHVLTTNIIVITRLFQLQTYICQCLGGGILDILAIRCTGYLPFIHLWLLYAYHAYMLI